MGPYPTIQAIHIVPQLTSAGQKTVAWGVEVAGYPMTWGFQGEPLPVDVADDEASHNLVISHLVGREIDSFRRLMALVNKLQETMTVTEIVEPTVHNDNSKLSRRRLLSGLLAEDPPAQPVEQERLEIRPLSALMRYALSQALLQMVAQVKQISIKQLLAEEYQLQIATNKPLIPRLQTAVDDPATAAVINEIQAIWYVLGRGDAVKQLGANNARLQRYVRQLKEWLKQTAATTPMIHLDLGGSLSQLYDNNIGKVLGAFYGLESAAQPYPLLVVDPVTAASKAELYPFLGKLKESLKFRHLKTRLGVKAAVQTTADVEQLIALQAVHLVCIDVMQWGSLDQVMEALLLCQTAALPAILSYPAQATAAAQDLLDQIAYHTQPEGIFINQNAAGAYNRWQLAKPKYS